LRGAVQYGAVRLSAFARRRTDGADGFFGIERMSKRTRRIGRTVVVWVIVGSSGGLSGAHHHPGNRPSASRRKLQNVATIVAKSPILFDRETT